MSDETPMTTSEALANLELIIKRDRAYQHLARILRVAAEAEGNFPEFARRQVDALTKTEAAEVTATAATAEMRRLDDDLETARTRTREGVDALQSELTLAKSIHTNEIDREQKEAKRQIALVTGNRDERLALIREQSEKAETQHREKMADLRRQEEDLLARIRQLDEQLKEAANRALGVPS